MPWPSLNDYTQAVGSYPHISILDPKLKGGTPKRDRGIFSITAYAGGFSIVFPIKAAAGTFALRCWIKDIGDAETRYKEISGYLKQCGLPYFVDFAYVPEGILVNGIRYPITRMEWAEGETLCDFIKQNLRDTRCLKTAALEFQEMIAALHTHQISHGDLQDGNILLERDGTDVKIRLIDYDSLFVPPLRGQPDSLILGLPEYQHPQRIAGGGGANEKVDYFSELVIYLSLLSLAEKPDLWRQFGAEEKRLLFKAEDFKNPDQSDVFRELENLSADIKQLALKLKEFCKRPVDQLEPLESVLPKTSPAQVAYNQGLAYFRSNRYNEAVVEFEKAIGLDPNYKEAHHGIGLAHFKMGDSGEAKRAVEAALRIDSQYQPAIQLLGIIESSTFGIPVSPSTGTSGPASTSPTSQSSPVTGASRPGGTSKPQNVISNLWQYITGALAFVLLVCIVVLTTQISAKDEALRRIKVLTNQQSETLTNSTIRTLSNKNARLLHENQKLRNQLTEQDEKTKNQIAIGKQLRSEKEELLSQNQRLRNQLTEQDRETKTQIAVTRQEKEELYNQNQTLRSEKEELYSQNQELQSENTILRNQSELNATSSSIRTLSNEKAKLLRENQKLRNQLTEQDEKTKNQIAIGKQLRSEKEELLSQNRKLHKENTALQKQLDKLTHSDVKVGPGPTNNQLRAAPPEKISNHIIRQVTLAALSKNNQGYFAFKKGQHDKAVELFQDAIQSDPRSAVAHYNLGCAYLEMEEYTNAVKYFWEAVALDSNFKEARYNLALAYLKWGHRQEAIKAAQAALNIDKNYQSARRLLEVIE